MWSIAIRRADVPNAVIDLDDLCQVYPHPERSFARENLKAMPGFTDGTGAEEAEVVTVGVEARRPRRAGCRATADDVRADLTGLGRRIGRQQGGRPTVTATRIDSTRIPALRD
jgi:hypothetical protein